MLGQLSAGTRSVLEYYDCGSVVMAMARWPPHRRSERHIIQNIPAGFNGGMSFKPAGAILNRPLACQVFIVVGLRWFAARNKANALVVRNRASPALGAPCIDDTS